MKKILLISIGTLLVLSIVVTWAYVFKYGKPKSTDEVFARFGFEVGERTEEEIADPGTDTLPETIVPTEEVSALRQLTTKPVAGAVIFDTTVRYVEQGTGHVYEINLKNGTESLLSGKTVPNAVHALFTDDGTYVAIQYFDNTHKKTIVRSLAEDSDGTLLLIDATSVAFLGTSTLQYLTKNPEGSTGFAYILSSKKTARLFQIPLQDVRVYWKDRYVNTTPTTEQTGYVYTITTSGLGYLANPARGLMLIPTPKSTILTLHARGGWQTYYGTSTQDVDTLPILAMPEKCVAGATKLFCAVPRELVGAQGFPDNWYKGTVSFSDILWEVSPETRTAVILSNFELEKARQLDVYKIGVNTPETMIWFINKNDNTLWMFDTTLTQREPSPQPPVESVDETATRTEVDTEPS